MTGFQEMLEDLAATPDRFERLLVRVPREHLAWRPSTWDGIPGEQFPPIGQLCHLRDIEIDGEARKALEPVARDHAGTFLVGYLQREGIVSGNLHERTALAKSGVRDREPLPSTSSRVRSRLIALLKPPPDAA